MKTFSTLKPCRCAALHEALTAAGIRVLTVRGLAVDPAGVSAETEIVTEDKADAVIVAEVLAAHDASVIPAGPRDAAIDAAKTLDELKAAVKARLV